MLSSKKKKYSVLKVEFILFPTENLFLEKSTNISTIYLIHEKNVWSFNLIVSELLTYSDPGSIHSPCFIYVFI